MKPEIPAIIGRKHAHIATSVLYNALVLSHLDLENPSSIRCDGFLYSCSKPTKLYDRANDQNTLDEGERIVF